MSEPIDDFDATDGTARPDRVSLGDYPKTMPTVRQRSLVDACRRRALDLGLKLPRPIWWTFVHGQYDPHLHCAETRVSFDDLVFSRGVTVFVRADMSESDIIVAALHELKHCADSALVLTGRMDLVEAERRAVDFAWFARQGWWR